MVEMTRLEEHSGCSHHILADIYDGNFCLWQYHQHQRHDAVFMQVPINSLGMYDGSFIARV